uniref:DDE Tnp4 domain-containing protein n=1 Tax=Hucho hucho TaxID=62062 RepID=A0A4W5QE63_9TELE
MDKKTWLIRPILHSKNDAEENYNHAQMKTRSLVERSIGVLKSRFRGICHSGGVILYSPEKTCKITTSACILHNICIQNRMPHPNIPDITPAVPDRDVAAGMQSCPTSKELPHKEEIHMTKKKQLLLHLVQGRKHPQGASSGEPPSPPHQQASLPGVALARPLGCYDG